MYNKNSNETVNRLYKVPYSNIRQLNQRSQLKLDNFIAPRMSLISLYIKNGREILSLLLSLRLIIPYVSFNILQVFRVGFKIKLV